MLYSIIYISEAAKQLSHEELMQLLETSRVNNEAMGLTGMLLYLQRAGGQPGGRFIQVLEGEKEEVMKKFSTIKADSRHHNILIISEDDIKGRSFETWSMGFKVLKNEELNLVPGYINLNDASMLNRKLAGISKPVNYLKSFYQINMERQY